MRRQLNIHFAPRDGGRDGGGVTLEIFDERSNTKVLSIDMTHEEAGKFVTSQGIHVDAYVSDHLDRVGLVRETKMVPLQAMVSVDLYASEDYIENVKEIATVHRVDGWEVDAVGYKRTQKRVTTEGVPLVPFYRYVKE